ncbi:Fic family protein [Halobaculum sp. MBLA0147]|uniref:Fic family protein n=1 Tax=Halobaculum sp. MBLA0147 TaxID=3079934 RepID=UPI00352561E1
MSEDDLPDARQVIDIHDRIEKQYDLKYTGAAVAAPRLKIERLLNGVAEHDGTYMRAAALLRDLITSHYFEDANKRTAWTVTNIYLKNHDAEPAVTDDRVPHILKRIRRFDVDEIADWLATGEIDEDRLEP